jgi:DNA-binding IclR family transcriptional regulator
MPTKSEIAGEPSPTPKAKVRGALTVAKALALLEAVAEGYREVDALAQRVGLARSTTHRLLLALVKEGYLRHIPRKGYRLGPKLIRLGFQAHSQLHLPSLARPHLEWLRDETSETVHLAVLDGTRVIYIEKLPGYRELQFASYIGARLPAQSTALGKALLAHLPEAEWQNHFVPGLKRTPNTISDFARFRQELLEIRERGYSLDLEENEPGVRCVAAPIFDGSGKVVAAVSVSSASVYLPGERIPQVADLVKEAARRISRELGG